MNQFELVTQTYGNKTFEFVRGCAPIINLNENGETARLPFGVEVESKFTDLPVFAGGSAERSFIQLSIEIPESMAARIETVESEIHSKTAQRTQKVWGKEVWR